MSRRAREMGWAKAYAGRMYHYRIPVSGLSRGYVTLCGAWPRRWLASEYRRPPSWSRTCPTCESRAQQIADAAPVPPVPARSHSEQPT